MRTALLLGCLLVTVQALTAQVRERLRWHNCYMGYDAGAAFRLGSPPQVLLDDPVTDFFWQVTASDPVTGGLLFHTTDIGILDANHQLMPTSSPYDPTARSYGCIPRPGHPNLYYILKQTFSGGSFQVYYQVLDMSLNGGLGDVLPGGYRLLASDLFETFTAGSSPVTGTHHLYLHEQNSEVFLKYDITAAGGLDTVPQPQAIGPVAHYTGGSRGTSRISPDGSILAMDVEHLYLTAFFRVDSIDGTLSNPLTVFTERLFSGAFSANSRYFYCARVLPMPSSDPQFIAYDVQPWDADSITASATALDPGGTPTGSGFMLKLAADDEIYFLSAWYQDTTFARTMGRIVDSDLGPGFAGLLFHETDLLRNHRGIWPWTMWTYDLTEAVRERPSPRPLRVFPNPADDRCVVTVAGSARVVLLDATGRLVQEVLPSGSAIELRTGGLAAGTYVVMAEGRDGTIARSGLVVAH